MTTFRFTSPVPVAESPTVRVEVRGARATAPTTGRRFEDALEVSAGAMLDGVEAAGAAVPGGGVVSAAVRGARVATTGDATSGVSGGGSLGGTDVHTSMMQDNMAFLELQQQMQSENQRFSTLSNVLKARHETAKNSINNIR
jgi:hypothetical protein